MSDDDMVVKRSEFAATLREIADRIENDESYECSETRRDLLGEVDYLYCKSFEDEDGGSDD